MAGQRFYRKKAILFKIETTYGTDPVPAGATDALLMTDVTFTPLAGTDVSRDLLLPWLGNQGIITTGLYATLQGSIEIAGAGTPGDVPGYGSLLRACGLSETIVADTSVTYLPVSSGFESGSLYFVNDGVKHVLLGARGTVTGNVVPKQIGKFQFTMTGLLGTITDAAMPTVDVTKFMTPVAVSKANTTMSLHGWSSVAESLSFDLGNTVTPRFLIGDEVVIISDRSVTGTAVVEARSLATVDWFAKAISRARGPLALQHGVTDGNIVEINQPAVEIGRPTEGQTDGIINYSLSLSSVPVLGNDELEIVVR
ncbi:hypothetical protein HB780_05445 (plasmid) [Rhizobium lusitanum]|uniref:phage tail tube protein n=1 Tax=Rhizobium lusitanum TaxID=293958 RepID=UPI0016209300|nr:hypothetical protein [Rhizobium lusitanum]QND45200.1 hypothetical protein HB780_05445 [Rhizobium lusitanum]